MGVLLTAFMLITSCASSTSQKVSKDSSSAKFQDDLSSFRPKVGKSTDTVKAETEQAEVIPTNDITTRLNNRLDSIATYNKKNKSGQGYRILVYSGNSSEEAGKTKEKVYDLLPDIHVYSIYKQPSFRVKVGDFPQRLEAYNTMGMLKEAFPNAMIVPDEINIVK